MRKYFEQAFEGFCNSMQAFAYFAEVLAEAGKLAFAYITLPLWIIPYAICKNLKKRGGGNGECM